MKKLVYILFTISFVFLFLRCTELETWEEETNSVPPGTISNPNVENLHGGARITYTLPSDVDLLGVKAVYSFFEDGDSLESFSSAYRDTIELDGFPDTSKRTVKLISIDKSKNESEPVEVEIQPLTPPVELIKQSFSVKETFGGLFTTWENNTKTDIGISLYAADSTGILNFDYSYYTNAEAGSYSFRGFDDEERKFRLEISDKWGNQATVDTILQPLFEEFIDARDEAGRALWRRYGKEDGSNQWRGDRMGNFRAWLNFEEVFDGDLNGESGIWVTPLPGNVLIDYTGKAEDAGAHMLPIYFTVDLGRSCKLSRHKHYHRANYVFAGNCIREYEIWATNETPKQPDDFTDIMESLAYWTEWPEVGGTDSWKNDWVKIADCVFAGPVSGSTVSSGITAEDRQVANAEGFEFAIDPEYSTTPFRYLRFVQPQRTWSGGTLHDIGEMQFWGQSMQ